MHPCACSGICPSSLSSSACAFFPKMFMQVGFCAKPPCPGSVQVLHAPGRRLVLHRHRHSRYFHVCRRTGESKCISSVPRGALSELVMWQSQLYLTASEFGWRYDVVRRIWDVHTKIRSRYNLTSGYVQEEEEVGGVHAHTWLWHVQGIRLGAKH